MKKIALLLGLMASSVAHAGWQVGGGLESYTWKETVPGLAITPKESGTRYALSVNWTQDKDSGLLFGYAGKLYTGSVNYSTATMGGTPVSTTTSYGGMSNEARMIYRSGNLDYVGGLGLDSWNRGINGVGGYTEKYGIWFLRLGLEYKASEALRFGGGLKSTINNTEKVDLFGATITPGQSNSLYADISYQFAPQWSVAGYYDSWRFSQSAWTATNTPGVLVMQPKSDMDALGVKVMYAF